MVSSFTFSNHIVLCHLHSATMLYFVIWHAPMNHSHSPNPASVALMTRPHKSIPSPRSIQCDAPHGSPPQINSIAPIQLCAPMEYPHKSISSFTSNQCRTPMAFPYKSIPSPWFSPVPPWRGTASVTPNGVPPQINPISPIQSYAPMTYPHKSIPSPHKSIPSLWSSRVPMTCPSQCHTPMAYPLKSIPSPQSSRVAPWRIP